jgi:hypothetical protein
MQLENGMRIGVSPSLTRRGLNQMPQRTQEPAPHGEPAV